MLAGGKVEVCPPGTEPLLEVCSASCGSCSGCKHPPCGDGAVSSHVLSWAGISAPGIGAVLVSPDTPMLACVGTLGQEQILSQGENIHPLRSQNRAPLAQGEVAVIMFSPLTEERKQQRLYVLCRSLCRGREGAGDQQAGDTRQALCQAWGPPEVVTLCGVALGSGSYGCCWKGWGRAAPRCASQTTLHSSGTSHTLQGSQSILCACKVEIRLISGELWLCWSLDFTPFPALSLVLCSQWHKGGSCLAGRKGRGLEWLPAAVVVISELTVTPPVHTTSRQCSAGASRSTWADHCLNLFIYIQNSQVPFQVQVWPYRDKTHPCAWRGLGWTGRCWQGRAWKGGHEPRCWMQTASKRAL